MNSILSGLAGAFALALIYGLVVGWQRVSKAVGELTAAFKGIPQLVASNREVAAALHRFSGELEFLRTVMTGGTPTEAAGDGTQAPPSAPRPKGSTPVQFPQWQPFVTAPEAPDAEVSDTEVVEQDDEALAEQEQIEAIRNRGYAAGEEADPMTNPPGMTGSV